MLVGFVAGMLTQTKIGCSWFSEQESIDRLNHHVNHLEELRTDQELDRVWTKFFDEGNITINQAIKQYKVYEDTAGGHLVGLLLRDVCTGTK